jgi:hypothetical protein
MRRKIMLRQFLIAWLIAMFALPAAAADWSHNNRIKPGENRNYEFTVDEDSSMLDARACATTVFFWHQDVTGTQDTGEATLFSCPRIDSVQSACKKLMEFNDDESSMAVGDKPGFFYVRTDTAPTGTAVSRVGAFCTDQYVGLPNYIRKVQLLVPTEVVQGAPLVLAVNELGYDKGYFVMETTGVNGGASLSVALRNNDPGNNWNICVFDTVTTNTDEVMIVGGESYELAGGGGVDTDCNRPLTRDMEINMSVSVGGSIFVALWFYGIPN